MDWLGTTESCLPTICWLNASDWFLHFLCACGVVFSLL